MSNLDTKIAREAEAWFARRLEPAVREAERENFEHWRTEDLRHAAAYADAERLWNRLAVLQNSDRLRTMATPLSGSSRSLELFRRARAIGWQRFSLMAAGLAAVAIIATVLLIDGAGNRNFMTALGEQRTETLADGTVLRLNTSSRVEVRITDARREIVLKSGEAAFDVAKDVSRPFVVIAGDGTITAIGTHFQVRHEGRRVAVTLIDGRVQLARVARREAELLEPGQQATFSSDASGIVRRNVDIKALTSWMGGRLEFRDTPLQQAVDEANRYSARKIRIGDPSIAGIAVSGTFRTGDVDSVASAFEAAFSVRAQIDEKKIVLLPAD